MRTFKGQVVRKNVFRPAETLLSVKPQFERHGAQCFDPFVLVAFY